MRITLTTVEVRDMAITYLISQGFEDAADRVDDVEFTRQNHDEEVMLDVHDMHIYMKPPEVL